MPDYVSYDVQQKILDYIVKKAKEFIAEGRIRHVEVGETASREDYPFVFIIPRRVLMPDVTVAGVQWQLTYELVFVDKEPDFLKGRNKIWKLGWDCYDKYMEDRQMNGLGELFPMQIEPDFRREESGLTHWCLFRFEVHRERPG